MCTGAVSRYKLAPEPVYYQGAMFLLCAVARIRVLHFAGFVMVPQFAKTVTSNLPILSVLGFRDFIFFGSQNSLFQSGNRPFISKYFCRSVAWTNDGMSFVF